MTRVQIRWEQRPSLPVAENLRKLISNCLTVLDREGVEVHLLVTGDDRIRDLNNRYLDRDQATDVLSFPDGDRLPSGRTFLGEIIISVETARRQADALGHSEDREILELALHGLLHLLGYDHERDQGEMIEIELKLREGLFP